MSKLEKVILVWSLIRQNVLTDEMVVGTQCGTDRKTQKPGYHGKITSVSRHEDTHMNGNVGPTKISFNRPAERQFFRHIHRGLKIRLIKDQVFFRPTADLDDESIRLTARTRGGLEGLISGVFGNEIFDRLHALGATRERPYLILEEYEDDEGDWLGCRHFASEGHPPRHEPHLRVWFAPPREDTPVIDSAQIAAFNESSLPFLNEIQEAAKIVNERRVGRPSEAVMQARAKMELFKRFVEQVLPDYTKNPDDTLHEAIAVLQRAVNAERPKLPVHPSFDGFAKRTGSETRAIS